MKRTLKIGSFWPRRFSWQTLLIMSGLLLLTSLAPAGQSGRILLRTKFKQGDITRYQMIMKMKITTPMLPGVGEKMDVESVMRSMQEVNVLKATSGGGEVEVRTMDVEMSANGQPVSAPNMPIMTFNYDKQGKVTSVKGLPENMPGGAMMNQMYNSGAIPSQGMYFPPRPVKPGDVWQMQVKLPPPYKQAVVHNTFVKVETVKGYKTAQIHTRLSAKIDGMMDKQGKAVLTPSEAIMTMTGTMTSVGDTNFAIDEGKVIRSANVVNTAMNMKIHQANPGRSAASPGASPSNMKMNMKMQVSLNIAD